MHPQDAVDLGRDAVLLALLLSAPLLGVGLVVGLLVSLWQAATQLHEQTTALVAKLICVSGVLLWTLPWLLSRLVEYTHDLIVHIPKTF